MVKAYFTNIRTNIIKELSKAKKDIRVAVYWFTNQELFDVLTEKIRCGTKVHVIIHNDYINNRETGLDFQKIIEQKILNYDLSKLETIIYSIASHELKAIEYLGGILGFFIGVLQLIIIFFGEFYAK
jgi:uncharacterized membrane protein YheB (UPF0754 family)